MFDLYIKNAGGATPERPLYESPEDKFATGSSPDGKWLVFQSGPRESRQVWLRPMTGDSAPVLRPAVSAHRRQAAHQHSA